MHCRREVLSDDFCRVTATFHSKFNLKAFAWQILDVVLAK
jgi:hypothetical protein